MFDSTSISRIKSYLADIAAQWKTGEAREHAYRPALAALLGDLIPRATIVNEPAHVACGAPDLLVRSNGATHVTIGGYQPAQKWLKDRKGRLLSYDDTIHYKSIILALLETNRLMSEL